MSDEGMKQDADGRYYNHEDREKCLAYEALVRRAVESVRKYKPKGPGRRVTPFPLWYRVKGIFHHGSGYSIELCRRLGLDPDETWIGEDEK